MSTVHPAVSTSPSSRPVDPIPATTDAESGFDARWAEWQARGRVEDAASRRALRIGGLATLSAAALAGIMGLSFGWWS